MTVKRNRLSSRPPIVVVMGHIDHGKTTLLDYIRQTNTVGREVGGITQAISGYEVTLPDEAGVRQRVTFIDTPGHEAFETLRRRGAKIADLAVLVIAADDGVKPQTQEAIQTIKEQKLPVIVAVNKIDKTPANLNQIKQQLAEAEMMVEGYGGQVPMVTISALTGQGVPELLELILLTAAVEGFTGDLTAAAEGFVLEAHRDSKSGVLITVVIKNGTLQTGDWVAAGGLRAKVKRLTDFDGNNQKQLSASAPATIWGFSELPAVGAAFQVTDDKNQAEARAAWHRQEERIKTMAAEPMEKDKPLTISIVLKADAAGALEALRHEVKKLEDENVALNIVAAAAGNITVNDLKLAGSETGQLLVFGFRVKTEPGVSAYAERHQITVVNFEIIYQLTDWLKEEIKRRQPQEEREEILGQAQVIKIFSVARERQIVGGAVTSGKLVEGKKFNLFRRQNLIGQGKLVGLEQQRLRAKEVSANNQFGALVEVKIPLAAGDVLEVVGTKPK